MGIFSAIAGLFGYHPEEDALNAAKGTISQGYDSAMAGYKPYITAGQNALSRYLDATGQGNSTQGIADFRASPVYQTMANALNLGDTNLMSRAAGSLNSGNTIRAVNDYNSQQANNALGQYIQGLSGTANQGYYATGKVGGLNVDKAGSIANIQNQIGQVQGANSIFGGLDSLTSNLIGGAGFLSGMGGMGGMGGGGNFLSRFMGGGSSSYPGWSANSLY